MGNDFRGGICGEGDALKSRLKFMKLFFYWSQHTWVFGKAESVINEGRTRKWQKMEVIMVCKVLLFLADVYPSACAQVAHGENK